MFQQCIVVDLHFVNCGAWNCTPVEKNSGVRKCRISAFEHTFCSHRPKCLRYGGVIVYYMPSYVTSCVCVCVCLMRCTPPP